MNRMGKRVALILGFGMFILLTWKLSVLITPQDLQIRLSDYGLWAPLVYIGLWVVLPVFFFPVAVLALAGGLLFGLLWGSVYTFLGAVINCGVMFVMARSFGRKEVEKLIRHRLSAQWRDRLEAAGGKQGFVLLIILRLIPAVPYNLINYAFGLTNMTFGAYLLASAIGIIPGTLAFIHIGENVLAVGLPSFWAAIGLLVLFLAVTTILGKKIFSSANQNNEENQKHGTEKT